MKKVIAIYYEKPNPAEHPWRNGLVYELEDGTKLYQHTCENQSLEAFDTKAPTVAG